MDENTTSRKLRVLIFTNKDSAVAVPLQRFLLSKGCPVRLCHDVQEFIDIMKKPSVDFGMIVVLSPINEKIFSGFKSDKLVLLEYGPGRCSVTALLNKVDKLAKSHGRY